MSLRRPFSPEAYRPAGTSPYINDAPTSTPLGNKQLRSTCRLTAPPKVNSSITILKKENKEKGKELSKFYFISAGITRTFTFSPFRKTVN